MSDSDEALKNTRKIITQEWFKAEESTATTTEGLLNSPLKNRAGFGGEKKLPKLDLPKDPPRFIYDRWIEDDQFTFGKPRTLKRKTGADYRPGEEITLGYEKLGRTVSPDVYGFYKSARHINASPFKGMWGIFINDDAIGSLAARMMDEVTRENKTGMLNPLIDPYDYALQFCTQIIEEHEYYHFRFDYYAKTCENMIGEELYQPLEKIFYDHRSWSVEESLANQAAWLTASYYDAYEGFANPGKFFFSEFKNQRNAYTQFDRNPTVLRSLIAAQLHERVFDFVTERRDLEWLVGFPALDEGGHVFPRYKLPACPVHHLFSGKKGGRIPKGLMVFL